MPVRVPVTLGPPEVCSPPGLVPVALSEPQEESECAGCENSDSRVAAEAECLH